MRGKKFRHDYNSCLVHTDGHYVLYSHHTIGLELFNISLPIWVKILIILAFAGLVLTMLVVEQKMGTIEEERNERKKY